MTIEERIIQDVQRQVHVEIAELQRQMHQLQALADTLRADGWVCYLANISDRSASDGGVHSQGASDSPVEAVESAARMFTKFFRGRRPRRVEWNLYALTPEGLRVEVSRNLVTPLIRQFLPDCVV